MTSDVGPTEDVLWERALDQLEADLIVAEQLLTGVQPIEPAPWTTPVLTTPLPAALADRARELLRRQEETTARLPEAMERARRQRAVTQRIGAVSAAPRRASIYLDATV